MTLPNLIRVLLVDDHLLFHDAVMTALSGADDIALVDFDGNQKAGWRNCWQWNCLITFG